MEKGSDEEGRGKREVDDERWLKDISLLLLGIGLECRLRKVC